MVLAGEVAADPGGLLRGEVVPHELVAAVAADVVERRELVGARADDDDRGAGRVDLLGEVRADAGQLLDPADVEPALLEDRLALELVELGRDRVVVRRRPGAQVRVVLGPGALGGLREVRHAGGPPPRVLGGRYHGSPKKRRPFPFPRAPRVLSGRSGSSPLMVVRCMSRAESRPYGQGPVQHAPVVPDHEIADRPARGGTPARARSTGRAGRRAAPGPRPGPSPPRGRWSPRAPASADRRGAARRAGAPWAPAARHIASCSSVGSGQTSRLAASNEWTTRSRVDPGLLGVGERRRTRRRCSRTRSRRPSRRPPARSASSP